MHSLSQKLHSIRKCAVSFKFWHSNKNSISLQAVFSSQTRFNTNHQITIGSPSTKRNIIYSNNCRNHFQPFVHNKMYSSETKSQQSDKKTEHTELTIPMPWGHIKAQLFGTPKDTSIPIVSVHGYLDNSNSFKPLAPYIVSNSEYYIIAIDLPGHGFSSPLPKGVQYSPKIFLTAVRRVIKHFDLKHFIFMNHSYGVGLAFLYDCVFTNEVKAIIGLDWIFNSTSKWVSTAGYWKEGIDAFIHTEDEIHKQEEHSSKKHKDKLLTKESALKILLKANNHLDEGSAKVLLERALKVKEDGHLEFSRDIRVKKTMTLRDHYIDFKILIPEFHNNLSSPTLIIHAVPSSYGEIANENTLKLLKDISDHSNVQISLAKFEGTHHFHMINPKETAVIVHTFLDQLFIHANKNTSGKL